MTIRFACVLAIGLLSTAASAQNTSLPSNDWNSSWGFPSTGERQHRLLQADIVKKGETGYYESLGNQRVTVTNTVNNDYSQGRMEVQAADGAAVEVVNHTGADIGQNTNVIGAINQSETTIDITGDGNAVTADNGAIATGCQDGSVKIDSPNTSATSADCN